LSHITVAEKLEVAHEFLTLQHGGAKQWRTAPEMEWAGVESASLSHFSQEGWRGYSGEGALILNLIKAAAFSELPDRHRATYTEAIFSGNVQPSDRIELKRLLDGVLRSDLEQVSRIFRQMAAPRVSDGLDYFDSSMLDYFPHLREWQFIELFENLGKSRLHDIAQAFSADPYEYRKGWPDLTLWRKGRVVFKEIKAPGDRLHASQRKTITDILLPLGYDVSIVDVIVMP
jgi:hypothetical protein